MAKAYIKNFLVSIALTYNYLANESETLTIEAINNYLEAVNRNIRLRDGKNVFLVNENLESMPNYGIGKGKNTYFLVDIKKAQDHFSWLNNETITATLSKEALEKLGITKEKILIEKTTEERVGKKELYSTNPNSSHIAETTKSILENVGYSDITITDILQEELEFGPGFTISYRCQAEFEKPKLLIK